MEQGGGPSGQDTGAQMCWPRHVAIKRRVGSRPLPCPPGLEKSSVRTPKFPLWLAPASIHHYTRGVLVARTH